MIAAGSYAIWYGRWELAIYNGKQGADPVVDRIENVRVRFVVEIQRIGATQLILVAASIIAYVLVWSRIRRSRSQRRRANVEPLPIGDRDAPSAHQVERSASECV